MTALPPSGPPPPWPPGKVPFGPPPSASPPHARPGRTRVLVALALGLAVSLVATAGVVVWQEDRIEDLRADLDRAEAAPPAAAGDEPDAAPEDPGLPGLGDFGDELGDALGGVLGEGTTDLLRCLGSPGEGDPVGDDDDARAQVAAIADAVEADRGLRFEDDVEPTFLDDEGIESRVEEETRQDYPTAEAELDRRILAALGAIPPDTDLLDQSIDLVAGQVAGFYDPGTGELVVRTDDPGAPLDADERVTLSHELEHALADQALGLPLDDDEPGDADAALAALALVEGDATLTMQRFAMAAFDLGQQLGSLIDPGAATAGEALESVPHVLAQRLLFPYTEGLRMVCGLYADGGWDAVDAVYDDLPTTTAQVLFPGRGAGSDRRDPDDLAAPGAGWERQRTDTFGAAELLWLLEAPGDDPSAALSEPRSRAEAWSGGELALHTRGEATALGLALVEHPEGDGLCATVSSWYEAAFPDATDAGSAPGETLTRRGDGQAAVLRCPGDQVRLGIGPDLAVARNLVR